MYDSSDEVTRIVGGFGWDLGKLSHPMDLSINGDGYIYVADTGNSRIEVFDRFGNAVGDFGKSDGDSEILNTPTALDVDKYGNVFVADTGNDRVVAYSGEGELLFVMGYFGSKPKRFNHPSGIACSDDGYLYVSDTYNNIVKVFKIKYETAGDTE
jgi:DNA-binding beta-propeller fold protein YncE